MSRATRARGGGPAHTRPRPRSASRKRVPPRPVPVNPAASWLLRNRNRRPPVTKTIMLIHGAWFNATSWEGFKARYEAKGYTVVAPSWPHDERSPAELRAAPHEDLRNVGFERILDH